MEDISPVFKCNLSVSFDSFTYLSVFIEHMFEKQYGMQGWRSGESTRLPPMWLDSQIRRHMWVEFVGSLLCTERFYSGTLVSPLLKHQHLI